MTERDSLLDRLELFVDQGVHIGPWRGETEDLAAKIDVLERVVELLRLRTGHVINKLSMEDLLRSGILVERSSAGTLVLRVASGDGTHEIRSHTPDGWKQSELQVPLVLFLFAPHPQPHSIHDLIAAFLAKIQESLSPADVETTKTGVTES